MEILAVNDDGIHARGIQLTAGFLRTLGHVTVVAPHTEQSGKSHSVDFKNEIRVEKADFLPGIDAYEVHSVPADCVRFGITGLHKKYDLLVSGMNHGENLGDDIVYSGTIGAVEEAAFFHMKAVAVSCRTALLEESQQYFPAILNFFRKYRLLSIGDYYNVNIPKDPKGFRFTKMGGPYYRDEFHLLHDDIWIQKGVFAYEPTEDLTFDTNANGAGFITITPLTVSRTDFSVLEKCRDLGEEFPL